MCGLNGTVNKTPNQYIWDTVWGEKLALTFDNKNSKNKKKTKNKKN